METSDLAGLVQTFFTVLTVIVIGRALLSWFDPAFKTTVGQLLVQITEPLLAPIRRFLPSAGGLDFSPIVLIIALQVISMLLVRVLR